jgi:MFS family permease
VSPRSLLHEYPTGSRRRIYLGVVVLAVFISAYEGQLAPVLPLLLQDFGMSVSFYGLITAASLLFGAAAGYLGGELVDRFGRVRILAPFAFLSAASCLFMAVAQDVTQFALARVLMATVEGIAMAATAPLIRDFAPRSGRAQAFAFWTWGPVGANFFAAAVAATTLQIFDHNWRSQIFIMAVMAAVGATVVAAVLRDLAPDVRRVVRESHSEVRHSFGVSSGGRRVLLVNRSFWAHIIAISMLYVFLGTMNAYGQIMMVESYGFSVRAASAVAMTFWVANLLCSFFFARLSDRLRVRRGMLLTGATVTVVLVACLVVDMTTGAHLPQTMIMLLLAGSGAALGAVFSPWTASFSETVEDLHPDGQGFAFGFENVIKDLFVLATVLIGPRVAESVGWGPWMIVALLSIAGFVLCMLMTPRAPFRNTITGAAAAAAQPGFGFPTPGLAHDVEGSDAEGMDAGRERVAD